MLESLCGLCRTYGSGPFPTGHPVHYLCPPPHRTRSASPYRIRQGKQIQAGSVSSAITAVGQAITLATNTIPTKLVGSDKLLPRLQHQQMLDGFRKADPPTTKLLPVEDGVPEYLVKLGMSPEARELNRAIGDLTMIAFYYMLHIGEYTVHHQRNSQ